MGEIRHLDFGNKSIIEIDYSDCKESAMIKLVDELEQLVLLKRKPQLILSTYNNRNFVTPRFMRHVESVTAKNLHLIDKMAFFGISPTQAMILKGYNLSFNRNFKAFESRETAIAYLLDDSTSDSQGTGF